jgi:hypothetical protein
MKVPYRVKWYRIAFHSPMPCIERNYTSVPLKSITNSLLFCSLCSHGTRCAGEVAAARDNGVCGVGVAYDSKIAGDAALVTRIKFVVHT